MILSPPLICRYEQEQQAANEVTAVRQITNITNAAVGVMKCDNQEPPEVATSLEVINQIPFKILKLDDLSEV